MNQQEFQYGTTGDSFAGKGSLYVNISQEFCHINKEQLQTMMGSVVGS
jgi:hypothetical protein